MKHFSSNWIVFLINRNTRAEFLPCITELLKCVGALVKDALCAHRSVRWSISYFTLSYVRSRTCVGKNWWEVRSSG